MGVFFYWMSQSFAPKPRFFSVTPQVAYATATQSSGILPAIVQAPTVTPVRVERPYGYIEGASIGAPQSTPAPESTELVILPETSTPIPAPTATPWPAATPLRIEPFKVYLFLSPDMQTTILEHPEIIVTPGNLPPGVVIMPAGIEGRGMYPGRPLAYAPAAPVCPWGPESPNCKDVIYITSTPAPCGSCVVLFGRPWPLDQWRGWRFIRIP